MPRTGAGDAVPPAKGGNGKQHGDFDGNFDGLAQTHK